MNRVKSAQLALSEDSRGGRMLREERQSRCVIGFLSLSISRTDFKASPNPMVKTSLHWFDIDVRCFHRFHDFGRNLLTSYVGEFLIVVLVRESIEAMRNSNDALEVPTTGFLLVDQVCHLCRVDLNLA